jgi:hypothetical protein
MDPIIQTRSYLEAPVPPEGMKIRPSSDKRGNLQNDRVPVIIFRGLTYWMLAFNDNRFSYGVGAYDDTGHLVSQWERRENIRYINDIYSDPAQRTFTFRSNDGKEDTMSWDMFILD